jgi:hypothetical protein
VKCAIKPPLPNCSTCWRRATRTARAVTRASLKAGFRYGDAAAMAVIELVDRDVSAKGKDSGPVFGDNDNTVGSVDPTAPEMPKKEKATAPKAAAKPKAEKSETKAKAAPKAKAARKPSV